MKTVSALVLVAAGGLAFGLLSPAVAQAAPAAPVPNGSTSTVAAPLADPILDGLFGHFNGNYVNIRNQPKTNSTKIYGQGQKGQPFCFQPYVYNNSWYYGTDGATNVTGYVNNTYIAYIQGQRCESA